MTDNSQFFRAVTFIPDTEKVDLDDSYGTYSYEYESVEGNNPPTKENKLNQFKSAKIKGNDFGEEDPNKELLEDEIILNILKRGVKTNEEDYNLSYEGDDVVHQQEQDGKEETSLEEDSEQQEQERTTSDESYQSWGLAAFDQLGDLQRGDDYEDTRS